MSAEPAPPHCGPVAKGVIATYAKRHLLTADQSVGVAPREVTAPHLVGVVVRVGVRAGAGAMRVRVRVRIGSGLGSGSR